LHVSTFYQFVWQCVKSTNLPNHCPMMCKAQRWEENSLKPRSYPLSHLSTSGLPLYFKSRKSTVGVGVGFSHSFIIVDFQKLVDDNRKEGPS
jgi:hypothetical protein